MPLLLAIEPSPSNLAPFDIDQREIEVFNKFNYTNPCAGLVANSILPKGESLVNLPATAAPNNYLAFPQPSFTTRFNWAGTEATDIFRHIVDDFDRIIKAGTLENTMSTKLEPIDFAVHGPIYPSASADELRAGFIQDLYAMQSLRSTWWSGGAWSVRLQIYLRLYNNLLLPKLIDGLERISQAYRIIMRTLSVWTISTVGALPDNCFSVVAIRKQMAFYLYGQTACLAYLHTAKLNCGKVGGFFFFYYKDLVFCGNLQFIDFTGSGVISAGPEVCT
ncbi:uncharacterized protein FTOL_10609 [Fusarium torulosum]|uniref:Uncharacterized protein n=1 Tax=Fusarium torulosum TaxID=33205 RepID=A0AAE8MH07_9HYPO|nr:uncharacterized protein FTOL_10609 [Fusarium torulosum]